MLRRRYAVVVVLASCAVVLNELLLFGTNLRRWDWLLVTGFATLLSALYLALLLPDVLSDTVTRLVNRKVLASGPALSEFLPSVHRRARRWASAGAVVFTVALAAAFVAAQHGGSIGLLLVELIAAVPVGLFAGRAAYYGTLGRQLTKAGFDVTPEPQHLDGAAGLLPVGELYFYQAKLLAIPGAFLAVWWFLIPLFEAQYGEWRQPYAALLLLVVLAELLVFIVPMLSFHRLMERRRNELFREADELSARAALAKDPAAGDEAWTKRYEAIDSMPTWPVNTEMRRRFRLNNLLLLVPVVAQSLGASQGTQDLLEELQKVLAGNS